MVKIHGRQPKRVQELSVTFLLQPANTAGVLEGLALAAYLQLLWIVKEGELDLRKIKAGLKRTVDRRKQLYPSSISVKIPEVSSYKNFMISHID